jgi:hypothetical protein
MDAKSLVVGAIALFKYDDPDRSMVMGLVLAVKDNEYEVEADGDYVVDVGYDEVVSVIGVTPESIQMAEERNKFYDALLLKHDGGE